MTTPSADSFQFKCPSCSTAITAARRYVGATFPCPTCGQRLQVPGQNKTVLGEPLPDLNSTALTPPLRPGRSFLADLLSTARQLFLILVAAAIGICIACAVAYWLSRPTERERIEATVRQFVRDKEGVSLTRIELVHKGGNEWDGLIWAAGGREGSVHVVHDGERVLATWVWRPRPPFGDPPQ